MGGEGRDARRGTMPRSGQDVAASHDSNGRGENLLGPLLLHYLPQLMLSQLSLELH